MNHFSRWVSATALALLSIVGVARAQSAKPIVLAIQPAPDDAAVLVAIDRGIWRDLGLDVKVVTFSSGREALEALIGGQADLVTMWDLPTAIAMLQDQKFAVVGDLSRYKGLRVIASRKHMNLATLHNLDGKRVGVTLGSSTEYLAAYLLRVANAKAQLVNVGPADMVAALARGDIDAGVMFPTNYAQAKDVLGDDYEELVVADFASHCVLGAATSMIADRPADLDKIVKGVVTADDLILGDMEIAKQSILKASKGMMKPAVLDGMLKDYDEKIVLNEALLSFLSGEATWVLDKGMIKAPPEKATPASLRHFIDEGPLSRAAPQDVTLPPKR
jgi:NitT/TauT family transport system substrate-binding protein